MSTETVLVSEVIFATRQRLYDAWLDSKEHSAFTSDEAEIEPELGGRHSTFAGYATGQNLALEPHRRIIQSWRTSEFPPGSPDSRLEVTFEDTLGGTLVTVLHTGIPAGQSDQYRDGWLKLYFAPMKSYFANENAPDAVPELEPAALAPAPARHIARPKAKTRKPAVRAKANRTAKARSRKVARPTAKKAKPAARRAKAKTKVAKKPAKKIGKKPAKKPAAKKSRGRKR